MQVTLDATQAGNRSGTGVYTQQLVHWLPRVAPDLHLKVFWPENVPKPDGLTDRVDFRDVSRGFAARLAATQWRMRRGPGITHYPATFGSILRGSRTVVTVHDLSFLRHPEWFRPDRAAYYRWAAQQTIPQAARVVADSLATANDLQELLDIPPERIAVVPLGVDETFQRTYKDEQRTACARYGLPERFILFMGTLEPRKNLVRLIEAWSGIAAGIPTDLVLAGRYGWKYEPVLRAALASPHTTRIHLPGFIDPYDVPAVLSAADAFVWPSLYEGFGLPPLEAMACGTPVVTSNRSSLPEVTGDAALLVDPEDPESIAHGLQRLLQDRELRTRLIAKGCERAANLTWRRTAQRTADVYRALSE